MGSGENVHEVLAPARVVHVGGVREVPLPRQLLFLLLLLGT